MIPLFPLGRSESSWLDQNFIDRALANAPPNTLLGEAPPPVNLNLADLHRQKRGHLSRLDVGIIWPFAHIRTVFAQRLTLLVDGVGRVRRLSLTSFREYSQLAMERANAEVSNPRDLRGAPAVALRFTGAIGLIPGLD